MTAVGALAASRARRVVERCDLSGAMARDALKGSPAAFDARIQKARPHAGQIAAAEHLLRLVEGSEIRESHREHDTRVQDAYCLRCMPQVHGAVRGVLEHVSGVLEAEAGSATGSPPVFPHTKTAKKTTKKKQNTPPPYAFDYAAIAMTDLPGITESR